MHMHMHTHMHMHMHMHMLHMHMQTHTHTHTHTHMHTHMHMHMHMNMNTNTNVNCCMLHADITSRAAQRPPHPRRLPHNTYARTRLRAQLDESRALRGVAGQRCERRVGRPRVGLRQPTHLAKCGTRVRGSVAVE